MAKFNKTRLFLSVTTALIGLVCSEVAYSATPIQVFNNSPVIAQLHQPSFPSTDKQAERTYYNLNASVSNYLSRSTDSNNRYLIDGETLIVRQTVAGRLNNNISIGASMPWVYHSAGIFDSSIYRFHDIFNMPQNGRTRDTNNQITWDIQSNLGSVIDLSSNSQAQGDLGLFLDHFVTRNTSMRIEADLPTGSFSRLSSDEASAASVSYLHSLYLSGGVEFWHGLGLGISDKNAELNALSQKGWVVSGLSGVSFQALKTLVLKAQVNAHTAYFDNDVRELGWIPIILSFEATYQPYKKGRVSLNFGEDLRPRTSPDFTLGFNFQHGF
jgi:hypothetical protein